MQVTNKFLNMFLVRMIILAWLIVHFTLTILYVSPWNPLRNTVYPFLNATIGTYFSQNWNLFAPIPISADFSLLVRPLTSDEFKIAQAHGLPSNGWYDLSAPMWTAFQHNRFSAYARMGRPEDQAIAHYLNQSQQQPVQLMVKVASSFCKDIGQNHASFVALVIYEKLSKPWLERGTSSPQAIKIIPIGIYPIDKQVEKMNLYK
jgi:hypothetical protein